MKNQYSIKNDAKEKLIIEGIDLLRLMHEAVHEIILKAKKYSTLNYTTLTVQDAPFWLKSAGRFFKESTSHDDQPRGKWLPSSIVIGDGKPVSITVKNDGIVEFPNNRNSYEQITEDIQKLLKDSGLTDAELASVLLNRISAKPYGENLTDKQKALLDALIVLLCGVESSRNYTTFLTTLMLLDLIENEQSYGSYNKVFTWKSALVSPRYNWDDWENANKGGKHPMTQHSTGKGNLGKGVDGEQGVLKYGYGSLVELTAPYLFAPTAYQQQYVLSATAGMNLIKQDPQRHQVPRREISLAVCWLESLTPEKKAKLKKKTNVISLKDEIKKIFIDRLTDGYGVGCQSNVNRFVRYSSQEVKQLPNISLADVAGQELSLIHEIKIAKTSPWGQAKSYMFHRSDVLRNAGCPLIPHWLARGEEKQITIPGGVNWIRGYIAGVPSCPQKKDRCPYCYSRPIEVASSATYKDNRLVGVDNGIAHSLECNKVDQLEWRTKLAEMKVGERGWLTFFGMAKKVGAKPCQTCLAPKIK